MSDYFTRRDEMHDYILDNGIATESEIALVTAINGYSCESLDSIIKVQTSMDYEQNIEANIYE